MTKPRSDAKLLNLPAAQQSTLTQWLLDGLAYHINCYAPLAHSPITFNPSLQTARFFVS